MIACLAKLLTLIGNEGEDEIGDFSCGWEEGYWRDYCPGFDALEFGRLDWRTWRD